MGLRLKRGSRKGAMELSMSTVVIIVIGITMLILGMVLVRNIMCGALGLTGNVNSKIESELDRYFGETGDEVVCIGTIDRVKLLPGEENFVYCSIKADEKAEYEFEVTDYGTRISSLEDKEIQKWIGRETSSSWTISPDDREAKKIITLKIPKEAPEGDIWIKLSIKKDGTLIREKRLDFQISRVGFLKSTMC